MASAPKYASLLPRIGHWLVRFRPPAALAAGSLYNVVLVCEFSKLRRDETIAAKSMPAFVREQIHRARNAVRTRCAACATFGDRWQL
jgi:hypothetical protein